MNQFKKYIFISFFLLLLFLSLPIKANIFSSIQTGVRWVDIAMTVVSGNNPSHLSLYQMASSFNLKSSLVENLVKQGFSFTDIYYLGFFHQKTGISVDNILKHKSKGIGWGEVAHRLGIHPGEFNKARVALKKAEKGGKSHSAPGLKKGKSKGFDKGAKGHPGKGKAKGKK